MDDDVRRVFWRMKTRLSKFSLGVHDFARTNLVKSHRNHESRTTDRSRSDCERMKSRMENEAKQQSVIERPRQLLIICLFLIDTCTRYCKEYFQTQRILSQMLMNHSYQKGPKENTMHEWLRLRRPNKLSFPLISIWQSDLMSHPWPNTKAFCRRHYGFLAWLKFYAVFLALFSVFESSKGTFWAFATESLRWRWILNYVEWYVVVHDVRDWSMHLEALSITVLSARRSKIAWE